MLWIVLLLPLIMEEQFALYHMSSIMLVENPQRAKFTFDGFLKLFCEFNLNFIEEGSQKLTAFANTTSVNTTSVNTTDFDSLDMQMNYISKLISIYNG